jgi:hypothetical protein
MEAPKGYEWIHSGRVSARPINHLAKTGLKRPRALCKSGMVEITSGEGKNNAPCRDCLWVATGDDQYWNSPIAQSEAQAVFKEIASMFEGGVFQPKRSRSPKR